MGAKLSGSAQRALESLEEARRKWERVRSLVEQAASARTGTDMFLTMIWRAATDVNRIFMSAGQGVLADQANQLAMLVKRGGALSTKLRPMREFVAAVNAGIDRAKKQVVDSDRTSGEATD